MENEEINDEDESIALGQCDSTDGSIKHKRLMQNRQSALKCRQKKKMQYEHLKFEREKLADDNERMREKLEYFQAQLLKRTDENISLRKRIDNMQLQQTLILATALQQK